MSAEWRKREGIIPLTQTEIMLVLATVILVLLIAKDASLAAAVEKLAGLGPTDGPAPGTVEPPDDPDRPVDGPLKEGGKGEPGTPLRGTGPEGGGAASGKGEPDAPPKPAPDGGSQSSGTGEDGAAGSGGRTEPVEDVATATPAKGAKNDPDPPVTRDGGPGALPPEGGLAKPEGDQSSAATTKAPEPTTEVSQPSQPDTEMGEGGGRVWVGFDPCWRRHAESGRQYYYAFDVTFIGDPAGDRFLIAPHRDWDARIPTIDQALAGDLKVLRDHPTQPIGRAEFRAFGASVESALAKKRTQRGDDDYTDGCLLAVTLDGDAPGRVAHFIRISVGLYPITRELD